MRFLLSICLSLLLGTVVFAQPQPAQVAQFVNAWNAGDRAVDSNADGVLTPVDVAIAVQMWYAGWSLTSPQPGARAVYVSSSVGNNTNSGLDPDHPVRTLAGAKNVMRDSRGDHLLLRRGDVWNEGLVLDRRLEGTSASNRAVIGAYGPGTARPRIVGSLTRGTINESHGNLIVIGIEIAAPSGGYQGFSWQGGPDRQPAGGENILIEDCSVHGFQENIDLQGVTNAVIRRCVITDSFSACPDQSCKSFGLYIAKSLNFTVEENVIDHNGWPVPGIFHHGVYLQGNDETNYGVMIFRRNIVTRNASHGVQMRAGGSMTDNLFAQNGIAVLLGSSTVVQGTCVGNVVIEGVNTGSESRGVGITLSSLASGSVCDSNIVARKLQGDGGAFEFYSTGGGVVVRNNIAYSWTPITIGSGPTFQQNSWQGGSVTYPFPNRTLTNADYAALRAQSRLTWDASRSIDSLLPYFRAGFGR